jgi:magnesium chelatase family protein
MATPIARIASRAQLGLHAPLVHVEVHLGVGLPAFTIVGLPATAVRESKERVRAALLNSKFEFPAGHITVNLAPADVPKEGGRFDLPIALGILVASQQLAVKNEAAEETLARREFYGELALSGELKPVKGLLLAAAHAARDGHMLVVPHANAEEALIAAHDSVCGAAHLLEVCEMLGAVIPGAEGEAAARVKSSKAASGALRSDEPASTAPGSVRKPIRIPTSETRVLATPSLAADLDLRDIRGQTQAKRALAVAAAGAHSLLLVGPPGAGKSMLAQRLPGLLPSLTTCEALEVATIASVSASGFDTRRFGHRPFRVPHHTASAQSIVGGGPHARPGEVSLAHHGVLFLDELPEFERRVLEALREPLETGVIAVSRASLQTEYPASFQLVAAMNPCPCGYLGDPSGRCHCPPGRIERYRGRISGPLLDRIDLRIEVPALEPRELAAIKDDEGMSTAEVAAVVREARVRQLARAGKLNSHLSVREIGEYCQLDATGAQLLWRSQSQLRMSARGYHRVLRVARTIADLGRSDAIHAVHVAEALQLKRALDEVS